MQAGLHVKALHNDPTHRDYRERQWHEGGIYENEYIKENGKWRILTLRYRPTWHADWRSGLSYTPEEVSTSSISLIIIRDRGTEVSEFVISSSPRSKPSEVQRTPQVQMR